MSASPRTEPLRVVVVGGGIAALETVLALHDLAEEQVRVTLIAPEPDFVLRPLAVAAPFSRGHVDRLALEDVMAEHSGRFVRSAVARVDTGAHAVTLVTGVEVGYDVLVLAQGVSSIAAFEHALTFGAIPLGLNGILADLEQGASSSVAFVVPPECTWPLPLYELALMTAEEVWTMNMDRVMIHLVTPELEPLEIFGAEASTAVAELLDAARITVHPGAHASVAANGRVETGCGPDVVVDRVVALPVLEGRRLDGIPANADGFVAVDDAGLVGGLESVYAVGDVTDRPIKQGGLACQQADVTAAHIAARAGAHVDVPPLKQVLRGRLLTGARDRFLRRGNANAGATTSVEPLWWPPTKVSGKYLSPYLTEKDIVHLPPRGAPSGSGVDVRVPVGGQPRCVPGGTVELGSLRPVTARRTASLKTSSVEARPYA